MTQQSWCSVFNITWDRMFQKKRVFLLKLYQLAYLHSHFLLVTWYSYLEWCEVSSANSDSMCFFSSGLWARQGSRHSLVKFTLLLPLLLKDCFSLITASGRVPFSSPVKLENLTDGRDGLYAWSPFISLCHVSKSTFQCAFPWKSSAYSCWVGLLHFPFPLFFYFSHV